MLNTNRDLKVGDLLYGFPVIADDQTYAAVTVEIRTDLRCCFWFTEIPGVGTGWVPSQLGPAGTHNVQDPVNPHWWRKPDNNDWVCIHAGKTVPHHYNVLCDSECGKPGEPITFPSDEEVAQAAERARRLLDSVRP